MSLDEAIDHAVTMADELAEANARAGGDVPDLEQCELEHRQLIQWLTELRGLRYRVRQLAGDLETTQKKLKDLRRDSGKPLDEHIHVTVSISDMRTTWRHSGRISPDSWRHVPRTPEGQLPQSDLEWQAQILREMINTIGYEAALGYFTEGMR